MKDALYFHVRKGGNDTLLDHTYCVKAKDDRLCIGFSIAHNNDQFCKKTGRLLASKKAHALTTMPTTVFKPLVSELPESIGLTIESVVQKAGQVFGLAGKTKVYMFINNQANVKVPMVKDFNIQPVTDTQKSNELFHSEI